MDLGERVANALDGESLDDVIPMLAMLLAHSGAMACSDKDVFKDFVVSIIDDTYAEIDRQNNSLQ